MLIGGQSTLVIELEDGLKKPCKVESNPLYAAETGRLPERQAYSIGVSMDDFASLALKYGSMLLEETSYGSLGV